MWHPTDQHGNRRTDLEEVKGRVPDQTFPGTGFHGPGSMSSIYGTALANT